MKAGDIMTREFEIIHPDAMIEEVAPRLRSGAGPIPVCENERLIGMISYQEIAPLLVTGSRGHRRIRVRDVVAPEILFCLEGTDVAEAAALMKENAARCLPVLSSDSHLVGVLALESIPPDSQGDSRNGGRLAVA